MQRFDEPKRRELSSLRPGDVVRLPRRRQEHVVTSVQAQPDLDRLGGEVWSTLRISGRLLVDSQIAPGCPEILLGKCPAGSLNHEVLVLGRMPATERKSR